jgi:hypothetical protein
MHLSSLPRIVSLFDFSDYGKISKNGECTFTRGREEEKEERVVGSGVFTAIP